MIPAQELNGHPTIERYRFLTDLNADGNEDLLLSDDIHSFGNAGGSFHVYLKTREEYEEIGQIDAHPKAVKIEKLWNATRIWVYLRGSSSSGTLGYYTLKEGNLSKFQGVEINPGDGGTELGNNLIDTVFSDRMIPEKSNTTADRLVTWNQWK